LLLLHEPPADVSLSVMVLPTQTPVGPVTGPIAKVVRETNIAIEVRYRYFIRRI
jgi:hypothetical protein